MKRLLKSILLLFPIVKDWYLLQGSKINRVSIRQFLNFKWGGAKYLYWPVHPNSEVTHPNNIFVGIGSNPGTRPGCYIQGNCGVYIGNYVQFASNIGIISANHDVNNSMKHIGKEVKIGDYSWVGMNAVILPGVVLGPRTIVAAGAVVTKSFPEGFCVIGGNPAKLIRTLDPNSFVPTKYKTEYYGFVSKSSFRSFAAKHLKNHKYYQEIISVH